MFKTLSIVVSAAIVAIPLALVPASAQSSASMAMELGSILASEEPCGLTYDQGAIVTWIEENIAADDMGFAGTLDIMTRGQGRQVAAMSPSALTANCAAVTGAARHFGFVE